MGNDQIIGVDGTFFVDVRDGTVEQHLRDGELRVCPPSNGKSVSSLMVELNDAWPRSLESTQNGVTTFPFGTCSAIGKTTFLSQYLRAEAEGGDGHTPKKGSRLLAALLSRQ